MILILAWRDNLVISSFSNKRTPLVGVGVVQSDEKRTVLL